VLLLTSGVLTRPWVLVELVTAIKTGVRIVLVEVQRPEMKFPFPNDAYYKRLRDGKELNQNATNLLASEGIMLDELENVLRQVFMRIAVPFSPHKSANIRDAELLDIMKHCQLRPRSIEAQRKSLKRDFGARDSKERNRTSVGRSSRVSFASLTRSISSSKPTRTISWSKPYTKSFAPAKPLERDQKYSAGSSSVDSAGTEALVAQATHSLGGSSTTSSLTSVVRTATGESTEVKEKASI